MNIADRIKYLRGRRGWSQDELAKRAREKGHDLDAATLCKIENKTHAAGERELRAIASGFGLSFPRLLRVDARPRRVSSSDVPHAPLEDSPAPAVASQSGPTLLEAALDAKTKRIEELEGWLDSADEWSSEVLAALGVSEGATACKAIALDVIKLLVEFRSAIWKIVGDDGPMPSDMMLAEKVRARVYKLTMLEQDLAEIVKVAEGHGWNGVENSKILSVFLAEHLDELDSDIASKANMLEQRSRELGRLGKRLEDSNEQIAELERKLNMANGAVASHMSRVDELVAVERRVGVLEGDRDLIIRELETLKTRLAGVEEFAPGSYGRECIELVKRIGGAMIPDPTGPRFANLPSSM